MTDCTAECREFVSRLLSPTDVGKQLGVSMRYVNSVGRELNLGIVVTGRRIYTEEDVQAIKRYRARKKYSGGNSPQARVREIEREAKPRTEITMSPSYQEAIRKLRGGVS